MRQPADNRRLPLLDALRTVAAIGVLLHHAPPVDLFDRTYLFVDLFFLLSGFVLTLSAEPRMQAGLSAADFMRARIVRLWPMMALGSLVGAAVFATRSDPGQVLWLLALGLFIVPITSPGRVLYPLNGPQWSLLWELVANVVHAVLLRRLGNRALLALAALSGAALIAAIASAGWNGFGPNSDDWWLAAPRIAWSYILGIWMARRWRARKPRPLADWRVALALPLAALLILPWLPLGRVAGDALAVIAVLPALFWVAVTARPPQALGPRLEAIGAISFPIYALHIPVTVGVHFLLGKTALTNPLSVIASLAVAAAAAWAGPRLRGLLRPAQSRTPAPHTA